MLYYLLYPLHQEFSVLNVFRYITFRAAYATITALLISFLLGPPLIRYLRNKLVLQRIREEGPESHQKKTGTPTMGGLLILLSILVPTFLWADLRNQYVLLLLGSTVWLGAIGFLDDYLKVVKKAPKGLIGRYKLAGQFALGIVVGLILYANPPGAGMEARTSIPFFKNVFLSLGIFFPLFVMFVITGASNAVNLTDGLDGLATGLLALAFSAFAGMTYLSGHAKFAAYLNIPFIEGAGELTIFCGAAIGASLGFLWYNAHPAEVFMGDTGSLPLGGALAIVAACIKMEFLLAVVGGVFVIEALSVIIQVASYRLRGRRVFKMAPIHHHFELSNWSETKVVVRFWIVAILLALLSLSTLKLR
ncbi:MAG: phospho-N-acetylmuramoyl-pentapeptide-transferase [bacterium]